jgi:hypothetical protein
MISKIRFLASCKLTLRLFALLRSKFPGFEVEFCYFDPFLNTILLFSKKDFKDPFSTTKHISPLRLGN